MHIIYLANHVAEKILPAYSHLPVVQAATQTAAEDFYDFDAFRAVNKY